MSVAWNPRLPYLYSSAAPGGEWQRLNFAALGKGKTRGTFGKKAPGLHTYLRYLLKELPRSPPSPVIRPPKKTTTGKLQHQRQNPQQYRYRPYLYPSGPITTTKKVPQQPQPETSFCPTNLPRNMSFRKIHYLIFDMHYAYYKVHTHTPHQIYH